VNALRPLVVIAALAPLLGARTAAAQEELDAPISGRRHDFSSPQHFALEFRFSPYHPDVDSDPALRGATPYASTFGTAPRLMVGAEVDFQALRIPHFGSFGPGLSAGLTSASGDALYQVPHKGMTVSGETTSLSIYPFSALAVLRADALWRDVHIPLVPYAKVGLTYALWRASNTLGTSHADGVSGTGSTLGFHLAFGLGLNLNLFDTYAAQNLDDSLGINGTYLFAEWAMDDLTGLGIQTDPLRVGGNNWTFGLAFEF
jgi:hypothetical protein